MHSQLSLFPSPRGAMTGRYHASTRRVSSMNTTAEGAHERTVTTTWLGMHWAGGVLRIRFKASHTLLRGGR